jgi:hypothetical protein
MLESDSSSNRFVLFCRLVRFGSRQNASIRSSVMRHLFSYAEIYREYVQRNGHYIYVLNSYCVMAARKTRVVKPEETAVAR